MPQIAQISATWLSQLFWLAIAFGAVFLVVGRGMVPRVQATIDNRDASVASDLAAAEAARREADAQEERWRLQENAARDQAQRTVAEARTRAATATEATLAHAGGETEAKLAEAEARIAQSSQAAMAEIEQVAGEAAQDIVARLAGLDVSSAEAADAVKVVLRG